MRNLFLVLSLFASLACAQQAGIHDANGDTPLMAALASRNFGLARQLLASGADPNQPNRAGITPLIRACAHGFSEMVEPLLAAGAKVNYSEPGASTPVSAAVHSNRPDILKLLLARGGSVNTFAYLPNSANQSNRSPRSLLEIAAFHGNPEIYKILIDHGAALNASLAGSSPLHEAVLLNHLAAVHLLLEAGANPNVRNPDDNGALVIAVRNENLDIVKLLLSHGANPNNTRVLFKQDERSQDALVTPLVVALARNRLDIAELLINSGADVNFPFLEPKSRKFNTALVYAVGNNNARHVEFLLKHGANLDNSSFRIRIAKYPTTLPLAQALVLPDNSMRDLLMTRGAYAGSVTSENDTIAHIIASHPGSHIPDRLRWLAAQGVPIDAPLKNGQTPLVLAVRAGRVENARTLLELGATPETALPYAMNNPELTRLLTSGRGKSI